MDVDMDNLAHTVLDAWTTLRASRREACADLLKINGDAVITAFGEGRFDDGERLLAFGGALCRAL